jgi:hypothetical protein
MAVEILRLDRALRHLVGPVHNGMRLALDRPPPLI